MGGCLLDGTLRPRAPYVQAKPIPNMHTMMFVVAAVFLLSSLLLAEDVILGDAYQENVPFVHQENDHKSIECHIAILGAGFSGSYAAYKLSQQYKDQVCVFDKLTRIGGRMHDVSERPGQPVYGIGALEMLDNQYNMLHLADELGIEIQRTDNQNVLQKTRGRYYLLNTTFSNTKKMCKEAFVGVDCDGWNHTDTDKGMWEVLLKLYHSQNDTLEKYSDIAMFVRGLLGTEGADFLNEAIPWQSFLKPGGHVRNFLEYMSNVDIPNESSLLRRKRYAVGGMTMFPKTMIAKAKLNGVRVIMGESIQSIESNNKFVIQTSNRTVLADRIINAIDPYAFRNISGSVAREIQATKEFQAIVTDSCATIDAWWDERFWERSKLSQGLILDRVVAHGECFNLMETPTYDYVRETNVTRAVYDDGVCLETWRTIIHSGNVQLLKEEIQRGQQRVFTDIVVPLPRTVIGTVHEQAWHVLTAASEFSNEDIRKWALRPISNEKIAMIGEAYMSGYVGWTEGALRSTMWTLKTYYGFSFPCLASSTEAADCSAV